MKPDWKFAPEWSEWLAKDGDGSWVWFAEKPYWSDSQDEWLIPEESKNSTYEVASDPDIEPEFSLCSRPHKKRLR